MRGVLLAICLVWAAPALAAPTAVCVPHRAGTGGGDPSPYAGVDPAPLLVYFDGEDSDCDGDATTINAGDDLDKFNCIYAWDFDDPGAGNWAYGIDPGTRSRNRAFGSFAGHVFRTAGTYEVQLTVTDQSGATDTDVCQVVVDDPDVTWPAAEVECISTSGTFTECPFTVGQGATHTTSSDFDVALSGCLSAGRNRCLFRGGETFAASATVNVGASGDTGIVGTYDAGKVTVNVSAGVEWLQFSDGDDDWRVTGFVASGGSRGVAKDGSAPDIHDLVVYDNELDFTDNAFYFNSSGTLPENRPERLALVDNLVHGTTTGSCACQDYFGGMELSFVAGNKFEAPTGTAVHTLRIQSHRETVLSNNLVEDAPGGVEDLKLHCFSEGFNGPILSENRFLGGGVNVNYAVGASDDSCHVRWGVIERNWFSGIFRSSHPDSLVRHNVAQQIHFIGPANEATDPDQELDDSFVQHNTCYGLGTGNPQVCIHLDDFALGFGGTQNNNEFRNTVVWFPNAVSCDAVLIDAGTGNVEASSLCATSNPFVSATYTTIVDFRVNESGPESGSIVDAGTDPGRVTLDPGLVEITSDWDLGAWCAGEGCGVTLTPPTFDGVGGPIISELTP